MKLVATFEITENQELGFRDILARVGDGINHGGLEIEIIADPVAEPEPIFEPAITQPVSVEVEEPEEMIAGAETEEFESDPETANSGAREEMSGDNLIVPLENENEYAD